MGFVEVWGCCPPWQHTLNAAFMNLRKGSEVAMDMLTRCKTEGKVNGWFGCSALKDNTKHPKLNILENDLIDPFWSKQFNRALQAQLRKTHHRKVPSLEGFITAEQVVLEFYIRILQAARPFALHVHGGVFHAGMRNPGFGSALSFYRTWIQCAAMALERQLQHGDSSRI